ncbi:hypothetical protein [Plantactinospora sp. B5E13]|uniref:hypothetical protein n=1 Tax=Plantactinospora sp. B5E13 TaxID=3153758 RepID=UPI00325E19A4
MSTLVRVAPRGDEVIQVAAGLWRMDVGPCQPGGVLLESSVGEDADRWPIDSAQARVLVAVLVDLLRRADVEFPQAA